MNSTTDRRRHPRVTVTQPGGPAVQAPFTLRDISRGGFCLESQKPFQTGQRELFEFSTPAHPSVTLAGTVRHCLRINHADGTSTFLAGFEFEALVPDQIRMVDLLLDEARHGVTR